jgi:hypothetical protein
MLARFACLISAFARFDIKTRPRDMLIMLNICRMFAEAGSSRGQLKAANGLNKH